VHLAVKGLVNERYLDDLRDKTHRGLSGRVRRGFSAGGRIFGYRTVPVPEEARPGKRTVTARFEIDEGEADVVRRVFRDYVAGRSMKTIVSTLNHERIPFPTRGTKRGPARLGWAVSTLGRLLEHNTPRAKIEVAKHLDGNLKMFWHVWTTTALSRLLRILRFHAHDLNLVPSVIVYRRWGKGPKQALRFTESGDPKLEEAYAKHFVWPGKVPLELAGSQSELGTTMEPVVGRGRRPGQDSFS
jgi:hypothetical protein